VANLEERYSGGTDVELTEEGLRQARQAGLRMREQGLAFDVVYSSVLQRARRTAEEALGQMEVNGLRIEITPRLNERNFGELEGMRFTDAARNHGEQWGQPWLWGLRAPGGESLEDVAARLDPFLEEQIFPALESGLRPLIVAHGNTIRVLDEILRQGAGERMATVPSATPLVYRMEKGSRRVVERVLIPR
jgi:2,3-bisphosphoglycerate-dependent phosphoglycerate mutase